MIRCSAQRIRGNRGRGYQLYRQIYGSSTFEVRNNFLPLYFYLALRLTREDLTP